MSAAPLGTGERPRASGPTAPVCLARATGTARRAIPRQVRGAEQTGSSKRVVLLSWIGQRGKADVPLYCRHVQLQG